MKKKSTAFFMLFISTLFNIVLLNLTAIPVHATSQTEPQLINPPDSITTKDDFIENLISGWTEVPLNSNLGVLTNTVNKSKIGFNKRGLVGNNESPLEGLYVNDESGASHIFQKFSPSFIPYVNNKNLYEATHSGNKVLRSRGIGHLSRPELKEMYFLKKNNKLRQVLNDSTNKVTYVIDLSLQPNLNFSVMLSMYNRASTARTFSLLELADTDYHSDTVPIYTLGNNSGFYMKPSESTRFTLQLKDSKGNWLSDYRRIAPGVLNGTSASNPQTPAPLRDRNFFKDDFSTLGIEQYNYPANKQLTVYEDSAYQLGAPPKSIAPNSALTVGYNLFVGNELPYMEMTTDPKEYAVYDDFMADTKGNYELRKIPMVGDTGTITFNYPNGTKAEQEYIADSNKMSKGSYTIPRSSLPEILNPVSGSVKTYTTDILAINSLSGLPSNEYTIPIHVYNLGAKALPQLIKQGTPFTKQAKDIVQNPVILPGHTASYTYEGDLPDTSKPGLTSVMVLMKDNDQPNKTTKIKVPIQITESTPPTKGLYLAANDFKSKSDPFLNISEEEVKVQILKLSEATAWNIQTGSGEEIQVSVETTTLKPNPKDGLYTAKLKAVNKTESVTKEISIDIMNKQKVTVAFLDDSGKTLHDSITFNEIIGSTIDLTKDREVQKAIQSIFDKNYQIDQKPDNETAIPVKKEESSVRYQFKGTLFIQSYPSFLNFGHKGLGESLIKIDKATYNQPLIIWDNRKDSGLWNLTATVKKALTSTEDSTKTLPSALRYKVNEAETVVLSENIAQIIATREHQEDGAYNISKEWDQNQSGPLLEVPSKEVLKAGNYRASILWKIEQVP